MYAEATQYRNKYANYKRGNQQQLAANWNQKSRNTLHSKKTRRIRPPTSWYNTVNSLYQDVEGKSLVKFLICGPFFAVISLPASAQ